MNAMFECNLDAPSILNQITPACRMSSSGSLFLAFVSKRFVIEWEDPHVAEFNWIAVVLKEYRAGHGFLLPFSNHIQVRGVAESKWVEGRFWLSEPSTVLNLLAV
jgi:hypothetical protein